MANTTLPRRPSDLIAPEITYHNPHHSPHFPYHGINSRGPTASATKQTTTPLVRPNGPASTPPRKGATPIPPPKPLTTPGRPPARADRNIDKVVLGNLCFKTWYPSYYGKEILGELSTTGPAGSGAGTKGGSKDDQHQHQHQQQSTPVLERLYVCPSCFKYSRELVPWWRHTQVCGKKGVVPGRKVYSHPQGRRKVMVPLTPTAGSTTSSSVARGNGGGGGGSLAGGAKRRRTDGAPRYREETVEDQGEWSIWEVDGEDESVSFSPRIPTISLATFRNVF